MAQQKREVVQQAYPPIPKLAEEKDIVEEYYAYTNEHNKQRRVLVGKVYCPVFNEHDADELFDPSSTSAKFYLEKHKKRFRNRRRYNHDLQRRRLGSSVQET